ncbi:Uncharacterised protein (plasmid) [Tsukamurella tyrosinosolvens]|nr:Uncharacterised protein [Tsukamurella tyrosinosolvens]
MARHGLGARLRGRIQVAEQPLDPQRCTVEDIANLLHGVRIGRSEKRIQDGHDVVVLIDAVDGALQSEVQRIDRPHRGVQRDVGATPLLCPERRAAVRGPPHMGALGDRRYPDLGCESQCREAGQCRPGLDRRDDLRARSRGPVPAAPDRDQRTGPHELDDVGGIDAEPDQVAAAHDAAVLRGDLRDQFVHTQSVVAADSASGPKTARLWTKKVSYAHLWTEPLLKLPSSEVGRRISTSRRARFDVRNGYCQAGWVSPRRAARPRRTRSVCRGDMVGSAAGWNHAISSDSSSATCASPAT